MDARRAGNGEWRIVQRNEEFAHSNNQLIVRKNRYVYWIGQENQALMTRWWMHEFVIGRISDPTRVRNTI
jgi:carotenoid cleavage dioxygenase-like enzyme